MNYVFIHRGPNRKDESVTELSQSERIEFEAAAFRRLVAHLRERTDVQNIDMMNQTGFCRNCLSRWYQEAANEQDIDLDKDAAREIVYGMPFSEWKSRFQTEATAAQKEAFKVSHKVHT